MQAVFGANNRIDDVEFCCCCWRVVGLVDTVPILHNNCVDGKLVQRADHT